MQPMSIRTTIALCAAGLLVLAAAPPAPAQTSPGPQGPTKVSIVYTANTGGIFAAWSALSEVGPLFEPGQKSAVSAQGLEYDPGTLRHDRWYLWSDGQPLTSRSARALFESGGFHVSGSGRSVPTLVSDYNVVLQQPDGEAEWLVPWLDGKLRETGRLPDVQMTRGTLYQGRSATNDSLWVFSLDGAPPPAEALRDSNRWHWVGGIHTRVLRGTRETKMVSLARRFGGFPLQEAVRRAAQERKALRVDAGNLVDDLNETFAGEAITDTLAELPKMGLDALVPFKYELRLPPDMQKQLASTVPLVAANLTPPAGIAIKPYVLREVGGVRIAIVGIADIATLTQYGLLGSRSGWKGEDPEPALKRTLKEIRLDSADAVVMVTNVGEDKLMPLREACDGCAAVLSRFRHHSEFVFRERFEPADPARTRAPQPWIVAGAGGGSFGILDLEFRPAAAQFPGGPVKMRLTAASNEGRVVTDDLVVDPEKSWRSFDLISDFVETRREAIIPDIRRLAAMDKRFQDKEGQPLVVFDSERWSRLTAAVLRQQTGAELSVVYRLSGGSHIVGDVPLFVAEDWMPAGARVALAQLTGAEIKRLLATDSERSRFATAGFDPELGMIGGRPIVDGERYLVATFDTLAGNESHQNIFRDKYSTALRLKADRILHGRSGDSVTVREAVLARLIALKSQHRAFNDDYMNDFVALLGDDGVAYAPRWSLALKPAEGAYQQLSVSNRDAFGGVRNSRVNTPNNTSLRGRGNVGLTYQTSDVDWENKALVDYQRAEIQSSKGPVFQEGNDNIQLTSEFRLKVFKPTRAARNSTGSWARFSTPTPGSRKSAWAPSPSTTSPCPPGASNRACNWPAPWSSPSAR